jgi:hypothetical protein
MIAIAETQHAGDIFRIDLPLVPADFICAPLTF